MIMDLDQSILFPQTMGKAKRWPFALITESENHAVHFFIACESKRKKEVSLDLDGRKVSVDARKTVWDQTKFVGKPVIEGSRIRRHSFVLD